MSLPLLLVALSILPSYLAAIPPNIIITLGHGVGYGDIGANNPYTTSTLNIDDLIEQGLNYKDFYLSGTNPSASMAALLTGRAAPWTGVTKWFGGYSVAGLPLTERTIADYLKQAGYTTGYFGVWDLGHTEGYLPTDRGFDYFYGAPYTRDDGCVIADTPSKDSVCNKDRGLPLFENGVVVQQPARFANFTNDAVMRKIRRFVGDAFMAKQPFFLIVSPFAVNLPKISDAIPTREMVLGDFDSLVGKTEDLLVSHGLEYTTVRMFSSKRGPIASMCDRSGSVGPFLGLWQPTNYKGTAPTAGTTWEGGVRVPFGIVYPGVVNPKTTTDRLTSVLDILPTIATLANLTLPSDRLFDGRSISEDWSSEKRNFTSSSTRDSLAFFSEGTTKITAIRKFNDKVYWRTSGEKGCNNATSPELGEVEHQYPLAFDLLGDKAEFNNLTYNYFKLRLYEECLTAFNRYYNSSGVLRSVADYSESDSALVCCGRGKCECSPDSAPYRGSGVLDSLQLLFASNQAAAPSSKQQINIPPPADSYGST
eukprot:sb/3463724/